MNDRTTIFPSSFLPPIAIMSAMSKQSLKTGTIRIERHETFPKQTHRNRTVIITAGGPMAMSVPITRPNGNHTCISDIEISYTERWDIHFERTIDAAYNASPYYMYYRDDIYRIIGGRFKKLTELNEALLNFLFAKLNIGTTIEYTDEYIGTELYEKDYRNMYSYKHPEELPAIPEYTQVFRDRMPFYGNVGILDALFNLGPETRNYLTKIDS